MTLIEFLFCFFAVVGAVAGAHFAMYHDASFGLLVLLAGSFAITLAFFGVLALAIILDYVDSWRTGRPYRPACRCGATPQSITWELRQPIATCPCGAQYVRHGREYREVLPGGASRPYLLWLPFRRWIDVRTADGTPELSPYRGSEPPR